jgi:hypothetical protein
VSKFGKLGGSERVISGLSGKVADPFLGFVPQTAQSERTPAGKMLPPASGISAERRNPVADVETTRGKTCQRRPLTSC